MKDLDPSRISEIMEGARVVSNLCDAACEREHEPTAQAALWGASITFMAMATPDAFNDTLANISDDDPAGLQPIAETGLELARYLTDIADDLYGILNLIRTMPMRAQEEYIVKVGDFLSGLADFKIQEHKGKIRSLAEEVAGAALAYQLGTPN